MLSTLLTKYLTLVAVFTFPLGLFNTAGHWQTMQTPYSCAVLDNYEDYDGFYPGVDPETGAVVNTSWIGEFNYYHTLKLLNVKKLNI